MKTRHHKGEVICKVAVKEEEDQVNEEDVDDPDVENDPLAFSGDLFCTLFTNFHSVQHFVHYLYTIEAVHYWTCCWIRKKIQGI